MGVKQLSVLTAALLVGGLAMTVAAQGPGKTVWDGVYSVVQNNPQPPVLVDGLWAHTERPTEPWETDIELPNINCEKCTLQIIQFMANHPGVREGGFSYHHCADVQITADRSKPIDSRWPAAR